MRWGHPINKSEKVVYYILIKPYNTIYRSHWWKKHKQWNLPRKNTQTSGHSQYICIVATFRKWYLYFIFVTDLRPLLVHISWKFWICLMIWQHTQGQVQVSLGLSMTNLPLMQTSLLFELLTDIFTYTHKKVNHVKRTTVQWMRRAH